MAKERLIKLSDDTFDKIIAALAEVGVEKVSSLAILQAVEKKYPDLVKEFRDLL
jgi:digeranylgeranylglycerophospholipid reductase